MSVTVSSTNYSGYSANVILYHPTGSTIPYYSATTTNIGTKTLPFTYDVSDEILEYGTFECSMNAFTPSKICTAVVLAGPDGDGNYYKTIKIGNQIWTSENLKTFSFRDGTPLDNPSGTTVDNATWSAANGFSTRYWAYVNGNSANTSIYGLLYNQYAVLHGNLCPSGWHVPTESEVTTLRTAMGGEGLGGGNGKIPGTIYWASPNIGANNSSGFSGVGAGYREVDGGYGYFRTYTPWWSSTTNFNWIFEYVSDNFIFSNNGSVYGMSVRCIKD